uniref:Helicase C-terminal domain-containing protein n=1 Tax=Aegilops tauschii subsp. strangulata TaxID=200361 RepID=A0A453DMB2_AEGTS
PSTDPRPTPGPRRPGPRSPAPSTPRTTAASTTPPPAPPPPPPPRCLPNLARTTASTTPPTAPPPPRRLPRGRNRVPPPPSMSPAPTSLRMRRRWWSGGKSRWRNPRESQIHHPPPLRWPIWLFRRRRRGTANPRQWSARKSSWRNHKSHIHHSPPLPSPILLFRRSLSTRKSSWRNHKSQIHHSTSLILAMRRRSVPSGTPNPRRWSRGKSRWRNQTQIYHSPLLSPTAVFWMMPMTRGRKPGQVLMAAPSRARGQHQSPHPLRILMKTMTVSARRRRTVLLMTPTRMLAGRKQRISRWSPPGAAKWSSPTSSQEAFSRCFTPTSARASSGSGFCIAGELEGSLGMTWVSARPCRVSAFLAGLFHCRLIKRVLVVAPKTLLTHWTKELSVVGLKHKIRDYSGASVNVRNSELQYAFKEGGILLTTYDIVRNNYKLIRGDFYNGNVEGKYDKLIRGDSYNDTDEDEDGKLWNYVILDEGHIIKNPSTQRAKSLLEIPCVHRIVISGTPIQNNLKEMWALFYFCCPEVLGDKDEFKSRYESAIIRGNDKNATNREKHTGSTVAKALRERIKPYFLRRMKSEVFLDTGSADDKKLSKKNELIVWLRLTACQRQLYEAFLNSDLVHSSMQGSPLAAITVLKKICDHPLILTKRAAEGILEGMEGMLDNKDMGMVEKMAMNLADMAHDDQALQVGEEVSCKLIFIMSLLRKLLEEGHHVLIFSQTRKMLNLIQEAILLEGYNFLRIDGTTKIAERERIVKDFQEGPGAQIFLLTTQVGGLGLTLTKAARVIVVDPAWNPSTDNQSVDRAYRIGQTKDVIVYRLMTSGTIEEKIYKLQVFKGALFRTATEQKEQTRYFSKRDIQELFSLPEQGFDVSLTQKQLQEEHGQQLVMDESLREHIEFLERQGIAGVSHHSLLFSKTAVLPSLEPEALESKHPAMPMMARQYNKASSMDYVANGAAHAFKPKDFTPRAYSGSNTSSESPEEIKAKINRLSQTLSNTTLVSRLPDRGEKLKKQIHDLDEKLTVIESSPESSSMMSRGRAPEVICLDDQSL